MRATLALLALAGAGTESWAQRGGGATSAWAERYAVLPPPGVRTHRMSSADRYDSGNEDGFANLSANPLHGAFFTDAAKNQLVLGELHAGPFGGVRLNQLFKTFMQLSPPNFGRVPLPTYTLYVEESKQVLLAAPVLDYFGGALPPFVGHWAYDDIDTRGGFHAFYPIDGDELRVAVERTLPNGTPNEDGKHFFGLRLTSWADAAGGAYLPTVADLDELLTRSATGAWPHLTQPAWSAPISSIVDAGATETLVAYQNPGKVLGLRFRVLQEGDWSDLWVRISADGVERVVAPLATLGGMGNDAYGVRAAFFGTTPSFVEGVLHHLDLYTYYPQPFRTSWELKIENRSPEREPRFVQMYASHHAGAYPEPFGHFTAFHREAVTVEGEYYEKAVIDDAYGKVVGEVLEVLDTGVVMSTGELVLRNNDNVFFLEGDVLERSDDEDFVAGDGTETEYGMAFYDHIFYDEPQVTPRLPGTTAMPPGGRFTTPFLGGSGVHFVVTALGGGDLGFVKRRSFYQCRTHMERTFYESYESKAEHGNANITSEVAVRSTVFAYVRDGARMTLVDEIDPRDPMSEAAHDYLAAGELVYDLDLASRSWYQPVPFAGQGYRIRNGSTRFTAFVPANNQGVRLSVRAMGHPPAPLLAHVRVDGQLAGVLQRCETASGACMNGCDASGDLPLWRTLSVELPAAVTAGKTELDVEVVPQALEWNEFHWAVWAYGS